MTNSLVLDAVVQGHVGMSVLVFLEIRIFSNMR